MSAFAAVFCKTRKLLDTVEGHHEYHAANGAGECAPEWADPDMEFLVLAESGPCQACGHDCGPDMLDDIEHACSCDCHDQDEEDNDDFYDELVASAEQRDAEEVEAHESDQEPWDEW